MSEQTTPDNPNRAESEAEATDRLLHGSSFGAATAAYAERHAARRPKPRTLQCMLAVAVVLVAVTAHLGGLLTHGADFFAY